MKKVLIAFLLSSNAALGQSIAYPKNYFISPMDVPLDLSGNFGELRPNHFHTGIDITTHNVEGVPVKSAADGYVSRVRIGPWGYGRVLYVTHPNGFTTVYGHLSRFNSTLSAYAKTNQYAGQHFEIDISLQPAQFPVKQGEIIAYSGNTGSSGGPHLHFEIRDAKTEEALNPLLFGLPVKDNVAPVAVTLVIIPADNNATVNGVNALKKIALKQSGSSYVFANASESITVYGKVGFAIEAHDKETNPTGKNGVYAIRLTCDGQTIYSHHLDRMPFDKSRFINCFINYEENEKHNRFYQQSFLLPNNQLPVYDTTVNNGYCFFPTDMTHRFTYTLHDVFGNSATVNFKVNSLSKSPVDHSKDPYIPMYRVLAWDTTNLIEETNFRFETPDDAFYRNEIFTFTVDPVKPKAYSPKINFSELIPIQKACTLTVYANIPDSLKSKSVLAKMNKNGERTAAGGKWNVNGVTTEIKEFGSYLVTVDTVAPTVTPSNFDLKGAQTSLAALKSIQFKMNDDFSGIASFNAFIDGKWVLMEYEPKKKLIWYTFDERCGKGKHSLELRVMDKVGNETVYKKDFSR